MSNTYSNLPEEVRDILSEYKEESYEEAMKIKLKLIAFGLFASFSLDAQLDVYSVGDMVEVSSPDPGDSHQYSFVGDITGFNHESNLIIIEDNNGDTFSVNPEKVSHYEIDNPSSISDIIEANQGRIFIVGISK